MWSFVSVEGRRRRTSITLVGPGIIMLDDPGTRDSGRPGRTVESLRSLGRKQGLHSARAEC